MLAPCGGIKLSEENFKIEKDGTIKVIGDGAGVTDYSGLTGKPQINGHELTSGNNTLETLGITKEGLGISDYVLPSAKTSALGGVKQAINVAKATGETPTKAEFDALSDFDIVVMDEKENIIEPISEKTYELERTKLYFYDATDSNGEVVSGEIKTTSRQANVVKTLEF